MADINITLTIPDAHVSMVKAAIEHFAKSHGDLNVGETFTLPQAKVYATEVCKNRLKELVLVYNSDMSQAAAVVTAQAATNAVIFS
jgi:hypothetical protein